jgi:hypothetical protein
MRWLLPLALAVSLVAPGSETVESIEVVKAKLELQRIEKLVADGGMPRNKLEEARASVEEAEQQAFLRRSLYGSMKMEDLNEPLTRQMLESAKILIARQEQRIATQKKLVEAGVVPRASLDPLNEELVLRQKTLEVAEAQARLWSDLGEMARAEQQRQLEAEQNAAGDDEHSYGGLPSTRLRTIEQEFETAFSRNLPVSARGDTAFHRTMGLNHTGRVDVAVNPDSAEGQWLRRYLDKTGIPYLAFRTAVKGAATAPHIHIGPPSTRLRSAD